MGNSTRRRAHNLKLWEMQIDMAGRCHQDSSFLLLTEDQLATCPQLLPLHLYNMVQQLWEENNSVFLPRGSELKTHPPLTSIPQKSLGLPS